MISVIVNRLELETKFFTCCYWDLNAYSFHRSVASKYLKDAGDVHGTVNIDISVGKLPASSLQIRSKYYHSVIYGCILFITSASSIDLASLHLISSAISPMLPVTTVARQAKLASYVFYKCLNTWICVWKANVLFYPSLFYKIIWCSLICTYKTTILPLPILLIVLLTGSGGGNGKAWGCDLSYKYVEINAEYTTWDLYSPWRKILRWLESWFLNLSV